MINRAGPSATSAADKYTYISPPTVTGVSPASGTAVGGTIVTITGSGFSVPAPAPGSVSVQFGTVSAPAVTVGSDTQITATSPAGTGTVDVTVTTPAGTSQPVTAGQFSYLAVTSPSVAQVGNLIVIAAQGPGGSLWSYSQASGFGAQWNAEQVAPAGTISSAPSVAQVVGSNATLAVIAAQGPDDSLVFYWQVIGSGQWNPQQVVAAANTTGSAPSVAQVGGAGGYVVIAAQGPDGSLWSYSQGIGSGTQWTSEQVG